MKGGGGICFDRKGEKIGIFKKLVLSFDRHKKIDVTDSHSLSSYAGILNSVKNFRRMGPL